MAAAAALGTGEPSDTPTGGTTEEQLAAQAVELVNQERAKAGLSPLKTLPAITAAAQVRVKELAVDRSHTRPDGRDGTTAMDDAGISASVAGENLAFGFDTAEGPVNWWMNSPMRKMNILLPYYSHMGVTYPDGNRVRLFAALSWPDLDGEFLRRCLRLRRNAKISAGTA